MIRPHMIRQFPIIKNRISFSLSNDYDSDYSSSDDKVNVQLKNTVRNLKLPEERPKSQKEISPKNNILPFEFEKDHSPLSKNKSTASFLSDDENLGDPSNHISTFITPKKITKNPERPFPRREKPDILKRKEELQPSIQHQQTDQENNSQDQKDSIRRKKRKKVPKKNVNQLDIKEKSETANLSQNQQQEPDKLLFSKTQPPQRQCQSPPPPSPQSPQPQYHQPPQYQKPRLQQTLYHPPPRFHIRQQNDQQKSDQQKSGQQSDQHQNDQQQNEQKQQSQPQTTFSHTQPRPSQNQQPQQRPLPQQLQHRQIQIQRNQQGNQQINIKKEQEEEQENNQNPTFSDEFLLSKTAPPRQRYNSSSNVSNKPEIPVNLKFKRKPSNDTNAPHAFPKPNYQAFTHTPRPEEKNTSSATEAESADEDVTVPRKRKKVSRKNVKLSISDSSYITFYYDSPDDVIEPPPGELIGQTNDGSIKAFPGFQTPKTNKGPLGIPPLPKNKKPRLPNIPNVQPKQAPFSSRPIPSPKLVEKVDDKDSYQHNQQQSNNSHSKSTEEDEYLRSEYDSETSEIQLGINNASSKLNKTFMSAAVFNDLSEQYNPSKEERQQAFKGALELQTSALTFHRVPTLAVFEQNANISIANQSEMIDNPQVAFSKLFFDLKGDQNQTETEVDFENDDNEIQNLQLDCNSPLSMNYVDNENNNDENTTNYDLSFYNSVPKRYRTKSSKRESTNLTLQEMKNLIANKETIPEFKTLEGKYRVLVNEKDQSMGNSVKPRDNLILYNLTTTIQPNEDDISIYEQNGFYCVETISSEAFLSFKFGNQITEPNPDHLHIFTWHNLHIKQSDILDSLLKVVSKIETNDSGITQIKSLIQYIFIWIYLFASDFYGNIETTSVLRKVLNVVLDKSKPFESHFSVIANDICFMKACLDSLSQQNSRPESYTVPMMKPRKIQLNNLRSLKLKELKVEPSVLVKHFTYIELELFRKINRAEIIKQVTFKFENKEQKDKMMPNYTKYYERFNRTAVFIALSILVEGSKNRAKKIEYWIKVMDEAKKFRNYFLLYEIDAALSCFPINRLEKSWKKIGKRFITMFNGLHSITNPTSKAIIAYKNEVNKMPTKTMPYIGPFLTELRYIYEGKKLLLPLQNGKEGYNMKYHRAFCNILEQIFQEWGTRIEFEIDDYLLDQCIHLEGKELKTEDLMKDSLKYEPATSS